MANSAVSNELLLRCIYTIDRCELQTLKPGLQYNLSARTDDRPTCCRLQRHVVTTAVYVYCLSVDIK